MKLSAQNWIDSTKMKDAVNDLEVNVNNISLVNADIKMRVFLALELGDVVRSDKKITCRQKCLLISAANIRHVPVYPEKNAPSK